jgi:hypothetical protein
MTAGTGRWQRSGDVRAPSVPGRAPAREAPGAIERVLLGDGRRQGLAEAAAKSLVRNIAGQVGRQLIRGVLGSLLR